MKSVGRTVERDQQKALFAIPYVSFIAAIPSTFKYADLLTVCFADERFSHVWTAVLLGHDEILKKNYALFLNQYNTNIKYTRTCIIFKPKKANKTRNKCTRSKTTQKKLQQIGHDLISGVQLVVTKKSEGIYTCTYVLVPISA